MQQNASPTLFDFGLKMIFFGPVYFGQCIYYEPPLWLLWSGGVGLLSSFHRSISKELLRYFTLIIHSLSDTHWINNVFLPQAYSTDS